jgi:glycosyltransferase involved in cell wall biosynthesis
LRVLFITTAFPTSRRPGVDKFLLRRAVELARLATVEVVVPTPWTPWPLSALHPRWRIYAETPASIDFDGLRACYPRYLQLPGSWFSHAAALSIALATLPHLRRIIRSGGCDILFAQSTLPDGLVAALLGRWSGLPAACVGRGTDVNVTGRGSRLAQRLTAWTVQNSVGVAVVAHDLVRTLAELAHMSNPPTLLLNGVDLETFAIRDRDETRRRLGADVTRPIALFVGRLVAGKGLSDLLTALAGVLRSLPSAELVIIGSGPLEPTLRAQALALGLGEHVRFLGERPHEEVSLWMSGAHVHVLPSESEGFPNVIREALACGTPVVATPVGDVPRIVGPQQGILVSPCDPAALARALVEALTTSWDPQVIRASVSAMTWEHNAAATYNFLEQSLQESHRQT